MSKDPQPLVEQPTAVRQQPPTTFQYVDRPELAEVFADFVNRIQFDGQTLRLEFCVTRMEEARGDAGTTATRYPAARLVLSVGAGVDLMNKMQQITAGLIKAGVLKADGGQKAQS
jgi:hypothetical protein